MTEPVRSLTELLQRAGSKRFLEVPTQEDFGLSEQLVFPFLALVAQEEMKLALLLALINPNVGGVLLLGPRGTGKTTAVRSLGDLLPEVPRSLCASGCLPEDIESGGIDAVCAECARKYGQGEPLTYLDRVRLVELPLNARLEDVVGGFDERLGQAGRWRLRRGLLARADRNLLYVDEANLLPDEIVDAILDAAAQGVFTVQRGSLSATYWARLALIGSMNPEEGSLRPQILDRFGLRVIVRGLATPDERLEAYRRSVAFRNSPRQLISRFASDTALAAQELATAREALPQVVLAPPAEAFGLQLVRRMGIDSLRAEITLFEAARAYASADGRQRAEPDDVRVVAPMALRLRGSAFLRGYLRRQNREEARLRGLLAPARPVRRKHKEPARAGSRKVRPRPG
ncbi:MAG: magnesium chelatase, ChlI subunit [Anaerolineales bacterium]|nr:magnesium chelatase, ChlI subunit [Anaerolineales bacterium]